MKIPNRSWPVILFVTAVSVAFTYGGMWIGLVAIVIGLSALGWSKRHEGPFPTKKPKE